jgi:hypothetical protein
MYLRKLLPNLDDDVSAGAAIKTFAANATLMVEGSPNSQREA